MTMNLRKFCSAALLGLASVSASAVTLDSVAGLANWKLNGLTTEVGTWASTSETTWGIGSITGISSVTGNWAAGEGGTYLYYMMYGIADQNIVATRMAGPASGPPTNFDIYNVGATGGVATGFIQIDVYRSATQIPSIDQTFSASPAGRLAFNQYSLLSGLGPAYLSVVMGPGKSADIPAATQTCNATYTNVLAPFETCEKTPGTNESLATMVQHTFGTTLPTTGSGTFFAEVVGGTSAAKWDTNGMPLGYDFDAQYTLYANGAKQGTGTCTDASIAAGTCFAGYINDPMRSLAVPEPATLALLSLGMFFAAGVARRKRS